MKRSKLLSIGAGLIGAVTLLSACSGLPFGGGVDAEDFHGVWEYEDYYIWVEFKDDNTYEWLEIDGYTETGEYTIEDDALALSDGGLTFTLDEEGGLIDSDGDKLFASAFPDPSELIAVSEAEFYGIWEYEDYNWWLAVYEDGTYILQNSSEIMGEGTYYVEEGVLYLSDNSYTYISEEPGTLTDSDGDLLVSVSALPELEISDDDSYDDSYDDGGEIGFVSVSEEDLYGVWEAQSYYDWLVFYEDGYYEAYDSHGCYLDGEYSVEDGAAYLDDGTVLMMDEDGWLMDDYGDYFYPSSLPEYPELSDDYVASAEDFYGVWEYEDYYTWVYFYGDGTYEMYGEDGSITNADTYYMENGTLYLSNLDLSFTLDLEDYGYIISSEGEYLFYSSLPDEF